MRNIPPVSANIFTVDWKVCIIANFFPRNIEGFWPIADKLLVWRPGVHFPNTANTKTDTWNPALQPSRYHDHFFWPELIESPVIYSVYYHRGSIFQQNFLRVPFSEGLISELIFQKVATSFQLVRLGAKNSQDLGRLALG